MSSAHVLGVRSTWPAELLRWAAFPTALAVAAAGSLTIHAGLAPPMLVQMSALALAIAVAALAERWLPFRSRWSRPSRRELQTDATSWLVLMTIVDPLMKFGVAPALASLAVVLLGSLGGLGLFPTEWPFLAQVLLAALLAELGQYAVHRAAHRHRLPWRVHRVHHSPSRLYWLNGFRVHPLNLAWHELAGVVVLVVIGVPDAVVHSVVVFGGVISVLQHTNADLRYDGWNLLFGTADLHRWHHAADPTVAQCNFGTVLTIWDHLFRTYRPGAGAPERVGVLDGDADGVSYLSALRLSEPPGTPDP